MTDRPEAGISLGIPAIAGWLPRRWSFLCIYLHPSSGSAPATGSRSGRAGLSDAALLPSQGQPKTLPAPLTPVLLTLGERKRRGWKGQGSAVELLRALHACVLLSSSAGSGRGHPRASVLCSHIPAGPAAIGKPWRLTEDGHRAGRPVGGRCLPAVGSSRVTGFSLRGEERRGDGARRD